MDVGRLKLVIPDPRKDLFPSGRFKKIVELFHKILEANRFDFNNPTRISLQEQQIIIYELDRASVSRDLLHIIRTFFTAIQSTCIPCYFYPSFAIYSSQFFSTKIESAHQAVPLDAIYFGNILEGKFLIHWEVSYDEEHAAVINAGERKVATNIFANFYYDQCDVLCVTFANLEEYAKFSPERNSPKRKRAGIGFYEILIRLSSIRRIIVDSANAHINWTNYSRGDRIHFELSTPAVVRRGFVADGQEETCAKRERWLQIYRGRNSREVPHRLALADSPFFTIQFQAVGGFVLYQILSRLRMRSGLAIEFGHFKMVDVLYYEHNCPYSQWTGNKNANGNVNAATSLEDSIFKDFMAKTVRLEDTYDTNRHNQVPTWATDIQRAHVFGLTYLIEGLISRGAVVKDQLLLDVEMWQGFLTAVHRCYRTNSKICLSALERTMTMLDEGRELGDITLMSDHVLSSLFDALLNEFEELCQNGMTAALTKDEYKCGYRRVRKVIITPTRTIYVVPETLMANRVIRGFDHDGTRILRVTFRDDDNQPMRSFKTSNCLIRRTLRSAMLEGITIAGRRFGYLGNSNSQMRDGGAYFMEKYSHHDLIEYMREFRQPPHPTWQPKINSVRVKLGEFTNLENIYKVMARLGQCFTQSKQCDVPFMRSDYIVVPDIIGGTNSQNDKYTFSDGAGMISENFARQVAADMMLKQFVPSCFQFRFRGMKGVLAVNPVLDEIALWAVENGIPSLPRSNMFGNSSWLVKMVFRDSQVKFSTTRKEKETIEIVKYSTPSRVALNKPLICILDQVSQKQSCDCHIRVTNRIEELAEQQLRDHARSLLFEDICRNKLKELPQRISIDRLPRYAGFDLSREPFFRSLVKAMANYYIVKQMRKQQFPIPANKGRTMLGVIDDTGQLQYGQVFVQYTENVNLKCPPPNAQRRVLSGKVMLTKSPSVVAGDVRVFAAVDIPDLHHLCDVIVFPQHGPRPHPDEMAGSDLDGDEYAVIWDEDLMLDMSEPAFDYACEKPVNIPIDPNTMSEKMVDFYCSYLIQDSIGTIANSFQFQADYYGINSNVCNSLAKKHAQAVDFPKTGRPPSPLRTAWCGGEPPEKPERQPDFHCSCEGNKAIYRSERLLGRIYRNIRTVEDVFKTSQDIGKQFTFELDPYLTVDGWQEDLKFAKAVLQRYNGILRGIMENYGIKTEAEAFSGCIIDIRNRISDRDQDDMSFYTTNEIIDQKITNLFRTFREDFFQEFGGWRSCLKSALNPYAYSQDVLDYYIANPPRSMQKKAVAYYRSCYELAKSSGEQLLSFAWLAYDVLAVVKLANVKDDESFCPSMSPVFEVLEDRLIDYCLKHEERIKEFADNLINKGLEQVMYLIVSWARRNGLFSTCLQPEHICLILVLFATGRIAGSVNIAQPMLDVLDTEEVQKDRLPVLTRDQYARMVISFFEYLASRAFRTLPHLSFTSVGSNSVFIRGQWLPMHEAAVKTYYTVIFNMDFDEILGDNSSASNSLSHECEPFVVDLPGDEDSGQDDLLKRKIMEKTGVLDLSIRRLPGRKGRVAICSRGNSHSLQLLRNLLMVKPVKAISGKETSALLPCLVYQNIMS